jgi:hypothetical protein
MLLLMLCSTLARANRREEERRVFGGWCWGKNRRDGLWCHGDVPVVKEAGRNGGSGSWRTLVVAGDGDGGLELVSQVGRKTRGEVVVVGVQCRDEDDGDARRTPAKAAGFLCGRRIRDGVMVPKVAGDRMLGEMRRLASDQKKKD